MTRFRLRGLLLIALVLLSGTQFRHAAAQIETTSGFKSTTWAITNARLVISPTQEVPQGTLVIREGLIVAAGAEVTVPPDAEVLDAKGLTVYPGFIDAAATFLIDPDKNPQPTAERAVDYSKSALAATPLDHRKDLTPEFEVGTALKYDADAIEARRKQGLTSLQIVPEGRIASGQTVWLSTSGAPLREVSLKPAHWASLELLVRPSRGNGGYPSTLMGAVAHLRQALLDAQWRKQQIELFAAQTAGVNRPSEDPVLDALSRVTAAQQPAAFIVRDRDSILRTLQFAGEWNFKPVVIGWNQQELGRCAAELKSQSLGAVVNVDWGDEPKVDGPKDTNLLDPKRPDSLRIQTDKQQQWKDRIAGLVKLADQQVPFAFGSGSSKDAAQLLKGVRQAIAQGLKREVALGALTRDAAQILGLGTRLGTLEPGRLAHVVVLTGPFDDERSQVKWLFVDGQRFDYNKDAQAVAASSTAELPKLAGTWNLAIESSDGNVTAKVELTQDGNKLAGLFRSEHGDGKLSNAKLDGRKVEWTVGIGAGVRTIELKFSGEVSEDSPPRLSGQLKSAFGAATKWTGVQEPAQPTVENPVAISVETEDDNADKLKQGDWPTETEADRLAARLTTGGNVLIRGATVLTNVGPDLTDTSVLVRAGKIAAIGKDLAPDEGMLVIDAAGRFVMPGIIDTHSHIMFPQGLGGVNEATRSIVCEVRVRDVVRSDDPSAYRALAGGVTTIRLLHGSANVIGGQDAVVKLKYGAPASEQLLTDVPQGIKFALGENVKFQNGRFPNTRLGVEATLNRAFLEALEYRRQWNAYRLAAMNPETAAKLLPPRRDLRLEALADLLDQQKFIHSHCYRSDEILMLLRVADGFGMRVWSLQHVLEGYKVAPEIAAHGASCSTFADWWAYKVEAYDATPWNAALLLEAGANVGLKSDDAELMRHLYQDAAKLVRYGNLSPEVALKTVTLHPARELGLQSRMGTLEVGKDADIAIFNGHPLNGFARCEMTLVDGEVYFTREKAATAMSETAVAATKTAPAWAIPPADVRNKILDLTSDASGRYALVGGTIHPVDGEPIPSGTVLVEGGQVTGVGAGLALSAEMKVIDVSGLHIYPGLMDSATTLGLTEIGKVAETQDVYESGVFQPDLRAGVAINPDSELFPVARAGGVTTVFAHPQGGTIAGQGSVVKTAGWTAPEMVVQLEAALWINWPEMDNNEKPVELLKSYLADARLYLTLKEAALKANQAPPVQDPRYEALAPYLAGTKRVIFAADGRRGIAEVLKFAEDEKLKPVIAGGSDSWKLAAELKTRDVPVILGPVMRRPFHEYDPYDAPYACAGRLHEAGVTFCFRSKQASDSRNVPFEAAMAVAYGLPERAAIEGLTLGAARILGVDQQLGSITVGKQADLVITDGSPLQPGTLIKGVFVSGQPFAPESRHTRLYEKYRARLKK